MLRYTTDRARPGLVAFTTPGQETERVYSYNPGARTGLVSEMTYYVSMVTLNSAHSLTFASIFSVH